jgi:hypothetical protein
VVLARELAAERLHLVEDLENFGAGECFDVTVGQGVVSGTQRRERFTDRAGRHISNICSISKRTATYSM